MTPAARVSAAIEVLDVVLTGDAAERVLTTWGRQHRFAGSGDRAAIRDHVFDALRRLRSSGALGGGMTGRAVMIGLLHAQGAELETLFSGIGYAPTPLTDGERALAPTADTLDALDCPAWLAPALKASLTSDFAAVMGALQDRAPVFLRANLRKGDVATAQDSLMADGIETRAGPLSPTALEVVTNPRRVQTSAAYLNGLVEIQDAASQYVSDAVPLSSAARVLDFCAGGGGKSLAMAARSEARFFAHDIDRARMADLPKRAARAGVSVELMSPGTAASRGPFDVVLVDAPCSGSGAWRRSPQGKWKLDPAILANLLNAQAVILGQAAALVNTGGSLVYTTCSLLNDENREQIELFLSRTPNWHLKHDVRLTPLDGGDGFYFCLLAKG